MTKLLQMSNCTTLKEMFAFLRGEFELAVIHFASLSEDSSIKLSKAEETFKYLYEKKKVGSCDKIANCHFTHLFVYALAAKDPLPELLQGAVALHETRFANMLLGLLVRKVHRKDTELLPRLSKSTGAAMKTSNQPTLGRHFSRIPRISKAVQAPPQQSVHKARQRALPVATANDKDTEEEISCLNAECHAFFRQSPIGQKIPVLLNRVPEQRENPRMNGKFKSRVNTNTCNPAKQ